jgi:DNA-binding NarL/FixJ family response regulator
MARARVVLAAAQPLLVEAFRALLEPEFAVVGEATDARALVAECERLKPDVALADNQLRLLNPASIDRRLRAVSPSTKLILLTGERRRSSDRGASRTAGFGSVSKTSNAWELKRAIRSAVMVNPREQTSEDQGQPSAARTPGLTVRQCEVLQLLAGGHSMKEVASILHVTPRTIAFHKYRMMDQLHVRTTAELVRFAVRNGVLQR